MIDYLVLSAELSLVALVAIVCLRSAPARWRLGVALVALFVVVLPWFLLPAIPIPVADDSATVLEALPLMTPPSATEIVPALASLSTTEEWRLPLVAVLVAASALGLAVFAWLALRQRSTLRRWHDIARDGDYLLSRVPDSIRLDCRIRVLPGSAQATASGLPRPTVWIGDHHVNDERCASVLLHELMHLQRRHPLIAVVLTFVRCLLWWQPFVWLWVWLARRELEYDCDEACANLLGHGAYRRTLATLVHDASPQPGLALVGRGSFNLRRVRALEQAKIVRFRHKVGAAVAVCLAAFLILEFSTHAQDGSGKNRAELVKAVENIAKASQADGIWMTSSDDLVGVRFDDSLDNALRFLADNTSRPMYLHADVASSSHPVNLTVAGTFAEVVRAVVEHAGLSVNVHPTAFVVADARHIADLDWIDQAVVLSRPPDRRIRLAIELEINGLAVPTSADLIVGQSNWTGFEAGGYRMNLVARSINEDGVDIELRMRFASLQGTWRRDERMPYGSLTTLVDGDSIQGTDGKGRRVVLRATAYEID